MNLFKKQNNNLPILEPSLNLNNSVEYIRRVNSIVSDQLGIGMEGQDPTENLTTNEKNYFGTGARHIYRTLDIVQRIIDSPAVDALRQGFKIKTNYDEIGIGDLLLDRLNELDANEKIKQFLIDSRLYSKGALMLPIVREFDMPPDRSHLSSIFRFNNLERVEDFNIIPEDYYYYEVQQYDTLARNFGEIDSLYVQGQFIHPSRYFLFVHSLDFNLQRGISILDRIVVACKGLNVAEWTITNLLLKYRALILKYPSSEVLNTTEEKKAKLKNLIDDIKLRFTSKSVAAVPSNYEFEYLQTTLSGLREATDYLYSYLSSVSKVPQSIIKGSAQGELASAEKDERTYNEIVKTDEQKGKLEKLLRFILPYLLYEKSSDIYNVLEKNGVPPSDVTCDIEFEPLQSVNPLQEAQIKLIDAQRSSIEIDKRISTSEEIRRELHPEREEFSSRSEVDETEPAFNLADLLEFK